MDTKFVKFGIFLSISLVIVLGVACSRGTNPNSSASTTQTVKVTTGTISNTVAASGSLSYGTTSTLSVPSASQITQLNVNVGDQVTKGEVLAQMDTQSLKVAVSQAQANVAAAQTALSNAQTPYTPGAVAQAKAAVSNAQVALTNAQQALQDTIKPNSQAALTALQNSQAAVQNAQLAITTAQNKLDQDTINTNNSINTATDQLNTAQTTYTNALQKYLGLRVTDAQLNIDPTTLLEQLGIDLNVLFNPNTPQTPVDNPATPWNESVIYGWMELMPVSAINVSNMETEFTNDWNAYLTAKDNLNTTQLQAKNTLSNDQNNLTSAKSTLTQAQASLDDILNPTPDTIAAKQAQVDSAQAALTNAQENLQTILAGADPSTVAQKQAALDSANLALTQAQQNLTAATITAPYDGIIEAVNYSAGQNVGANATLLTIVNPTSIELNAQVDEVDILQVKVGQTVDISLSASTGAPVQGKIVSISPTAQVQSGVASYAVSMSLDSRIASQLKAGMSATANIIVSQKSNVLVVPTRAVQRSGAQLYVNMVVNGQVQKQNVTTGLSDSRNVEITGGLKEGDEVQIDTSSSSSSSSFQFRGGAGGLGGVLGGGGGGQVFIGRGGG